MPDKPEAEPTHFHVEVQEVFYVLHEVDAARKDIARDLVEQKKLGKETGRKLVSRLVANVHPVREGCCSKESKKAD